MKISPVMKVGGSGSSGIKFACFSSYGIVMAAYALPAECGVLGDEGTVQ